MPQDKYSAMLYVTNMAAGVGDISGDVSAIKKSVALSQEDMKNAGG